MIDPGPDIAARELSANREELRSLLAPRDRRAGDIADADQFPRSRLMRSLMGPKVATGMALVGIVALALKPQLAGRVLSKVPVRLLVTRLLTTP